MKKTRTRLWSLLLTVAMLLTLLPTTALAGDETAYTALKEAVEAAPANGKQTVVTLTGDIAGMTTDQIITIEEGQDILLDMAGYSITVAEEFAGRPIVNYGTLTLTGNGTIDSSMSNTGYGAINNYGTLTIENGTYRGNTYASGAVIRNAQADAYLLIEDGLFEDATCAIYNLGTAVINGGSYYGTTCSQCNSNIWSYTIRNDSVEARMTINGGYFEGVQGAVSAAVGVLTVNDGTFKTVKCKNNGNHTATFYALYAAGEVGEVECYINGGTFETEGKYAAALIGNDNTGGDGGINAPATAYISGGTFIAPENVPALKGAEKTGDPIIIGGTFSSNVSQYVPKSSEMVENSDGTITVVPLTAADAVAKVIRNGRTDYYKTLSDAVAEAQAGDTVTLLKDASGDGVVVPSDSDIIFDFAGHTYNIDGTTVGSAGTETNGFQLLRDSNVEFRNGTLVSAKAAILIQNYSNLTLQDMVLISEKSKAYALSNNFGKINIVGSTSITAASDGVAFDVYYWPGGGYSNGVSVTLDTTGTITGRIEYGSDGTDAGKAGVAENARLSIKQGAIKGYIYTYGLSDDKETDIAVSGGTFTSSVKEYVVEGLGYELNNQGEYSYYETLDEALSYAKPGAGITDLTDEGGGEALNVAIVTFDPNNGSRDWSVPVVVGDSVARPADPERAGYRFVGWYLNGYFYDFGAPVTADLTLTALWKEIGGSSGSTEPTYVAALEKMTNGSAVVSPKQAQEGDEVTITVTPDAGYVVDEVIVTDAHGDDVRVYEEGNNVYTFTMPDSRVTIEVTFKAKETAPAVPTAPAGWVNPFTDVASNAWYYDAVGYANANGLMGGTSATTFAPNGAMNRSMVWTVIARLAGQTISGATWAEDAKAWAVAQGVSDGTNPDGNVTREELVTMLYRYAGSPEMGVPELGLIGGYPDAASVSDWAESALAWALSTGVIDGRDGKLASGESVTRAEAATILARFHLLTK